MLEYFCLCHSSDPSGHSSPPDVEISGPGGSARKEQGQGDCKVEFFQGYPDRTPAAALGPVLQKTHPCYRYRSAPPSVHGP